MPPGDHAVHGECCRLGHGSWRQPQGICFRYQACFRSNDGPSQNCSRQHSCNNLLTSRQQSVRHCEHSVHSCNRCSPRYGPILHYKGCRSGLDPQLRLGSRKTQHQVCAGFGHAIHVCAFQQIQLVIGYCANLYMSLTNGCTKHIGYMRMHNMFSTLIRWPC